MTSPPEARAQENVDAVVSPRGPSIFKKWFQRKGNKGPVSHKPDRRSGKSRVPADRRSPPHPQTRVDDNHEGPSWMAAAQPTPVSAIPWLMVGCSVPTYYSSEWLQDRGEDERFVVPRVWMQGLITRYRINHVARLLFQKIRTKILPVADKVLRATTKPAKFVFFLAAMELVSIAYVPLGTTNERSISTLGLGGPSNGARYLPCTSIVRLSTSISARIKSCYPFIHVSRVDIVFSFRYTR